MNIILEAGKLQDKMTAYRREIHKNAEVGLKTEKTGAYVKEKLREMGYDPMELGGSGIVALAGGKKPGKVILLRADMDALPIQEETDEPFKCEEPYMHACGHDLHTAMLLGAAEIIKNMEDELEGTVKLMFQPGEEILEGAKLMIEAGVLENPNVDEAMMVHVASGFPIPTGAVVIPDQHGPFMAASDWYDITIQGKGGHGAMPESTVDPLNIAAHTHIALQAINAREAARTEALAMTIGRMSGGTTNNVIPDTAELSGTIRTFSEETRTMVHKRIKEIAEGTAMTFGGTASVDIRRGVPSFIADGHVIKKVEEGLQTILPKEAILPMSRIIPSGKVMGSEDFSFISHKVPSIQVTIPAGDQNEGYLYPVHHPKVRFDEKALTIGAAVYVTSALAMLKGGDGL